VRWIGPSALFRPTSLLDGIGIIIVKGLWDRLLPGIIAGNDGDQANAGCERPFGERPHRRGRGEMLRPLHKVQRFSSPDGAPRVEAIHAHQIVRIILSMDQVRNRFGLFRIAQFDPPDSVDGAMGFRHGQGHHPMPESCLFVGAP
jgi:hypothetical protein